MGKILESLFDEIVAKDVKDDHGTDNMSAIIVKFDKIESSYFHWNGNQLDNNTKWVIKFKKI